MKNPSSLYGTEYIYSHWEGREVPRGEDEGCFYGAGLTGKALMDELGLKGRAIDQEYSASSDIDVLIVSESLFTGYVMRSLEWLERVTSGDRKPEGGFTQPKIDGQTTWHIRTLASNAAKGIWRPDSLPRDAEVRNEFFDQFSDVSS